MATPAMPLDRSRLANVRPRDDGSYTARCPACAKLEADKKGEHLIVYADGRFGCVVNPRDREHNRLILDLAGVKRDQNRDKSRKPKLGPPTAIYRYFTADGTFLGEKLRFVVDGKKTFRWRHRRPDAHPCDPDPGCWDWHRPEGVALYRLPELLAAVAAGTAVWLVEGEKDADNLAAAGLAATSSPHGGSKGGIHGKWRPEFNAHFNGASVVIFADADETGRKFAQAVAAQLRPVVKSLKVVEAPAVNGAQPKDASDFLAAGGTSEQLAAHTAAAPEWRAQAPQKTGTARGECLPDTDETAASAEPEAETDGARVARLARLPPLEYDRIRVAEAKAAGVRTGTLDKMVEARRGEEDSGSGQGRELSFDDPEPWPDPVDGAALLDALSAAWSRHLVLPPGAAPALAAWSLYTYGVTLFDFSPLIFVTAPEGRCGKSRCADVAELLVHRPLRTGSATPAFIFRVIELHRPVLFLDEFDNCDLEKRSELLAILNDGYHRKGASAGPSARTTSRGCSRPTAPRCSSPSAIRCPTPPAAGPSSSR